MPFEQRNTIVSLTIAVLVTLFFGLRIAQLVGSGSFVDENVFRLWLFVIAAMVGGTIVSIILANIGHGMLYALRTGEEPEEQEFLEDERDRLIELSGTRVAHAVASLGTLAAMLTYVLGQPPLVMFTVLIGGGLVSQIVGNVYRLARYQRGF